MTELAVTVLAASAAAFALALLSAVAGFGGGVLLLPVFTVLFGLRVAVPVLTLTQLSGNGSRVWLTRRDLRLPVIGRFALGAVPFAVIGGLLLAHTPLAPLKRLLGVLLIGMVVWRRAGRQPRTPAEPAFAAVGAASGLGSALLGSVGPLTAPFFLAAGLTRAAYIGTEAASALTMHLTKIATYGAGDLLTRQVLLYGAALTPATLLGAGQHRRGLRAQELPPSRVGTPVRRWRYARTLQGPPDHRGTDLASELEQLTLNPLVAPTAVLRGHPFDQPGDRVVNRRTPAPVWDRSTSRLPADGAGAGSCPG